MALDQSALSDLLAALHARRGYGLHAGGDATDGHSEVLGLAVGDSEDASFWTAFLRSLRARGLGGVHLVISDAHSGLR